MAQLEICSRNPYLSIKFKCNKIWIYVASSDLKARGVWGEIVDFLQARKKQQSNIQKNIVIACQNIMIWQGWVEFYKTNFVATSWLFVASFLIIIPLYLYVDIFAPRPSIIYFSNNKLGFWARKKDDIFVNLLGGFIAAIFTTILALVFLKN